MIIKDKCYFFKLIPEGQPAQYISEPIKWDQVNIIMKRDPEWHGVNYEYSDGEIELEFDCDAGKDIIEDVYQEQGINGLIIFQFGYTYQQDRYPVEIIDYEGKLNLSTRKIIKNRVACSIERSGLHDLVKSRFETKVNLFAETDLDNNAIPNPGTFDLLLHPKVLVNNYNKRVKPEGVQSWTYLGKNNWQDVYFTYDTIPGSNEDSNIHQVAGTNKGIMATNPVDSEMFLFNMENSGELEFNIKLNIEINVGLQPTALGGTPQINDWSYESYLVINNNRYRIGERLTGRAGSRELGPKRITSNLNGKFYVNRGEKVFIYGFFTFYRNSNKSKDTYAWIRDYGSTFNVSAKTLSEYSSAKSLMVYESLQHAAKLATGIDKPVYSEFFGRQELGYYVDGCGSKNVITNGFEIRAFSRSNDNYKSPQISLSSLLKSLNAMFCIGMAYENIGGMDRLRIEQRDYFYKDVEIMELTDIGDYTEETAKDLVYNNIEIGYKKYLDEGLKLIDEFNTQHQYASPINRHDNPFSQLSDLIGSGYALEVTRRYQFAFTEQDSAKYDDDCFIISVRKDEAKNILILFDRVLLVANYIRFPQYTTIPFRVKVGDSVKVTGTGTSNDKEYRVIAIGENFIRVQQSISSGAYFGNINNVSAPYSTEKDEPFDYVDNLISPETSYNLRHTPKRMLLRWAKWLNGGFYYQQPGDIIKNTFFKQNGALTTRLKATEPCPLGDLNQQNIQESSDLYLADFHDRDRYFIPDYANFTTRLTKDQLNVIRDCMRGQDQLGRNYGYVTLPLPDGNKLKAWIWELQYNPNTEKVTFKVLKKEIIYINEQPFNCSEYADWTFGDFEAKPDLSKKIELCRFQSFN